MVRVRDEIRRLGEDQEQRLRSKVKAVENGDMPHWRQESLDKLFQRLRVNFCELQSCAGLEDGVAPDAAMAQQKAADIANLAMLIALRVETVA